jgi:hypothetical protein
MQGNRNMRRQSKVLTYLVLAWLPAAAAAASERRVPADSRSPVAVSIADSAGGVVRLVGRFTTPASAAVAWGVLTDYDHIQDFVSSMRSSRVKCRGNGYLLVEQESTGRALFVTRTLHLLLEVREEPRRSIAFEDVSRTSFERYQGSWSLAEVPGGGVEVTYRLTVKGGSMAPGFVMRGASRKMVAELLDQVRTRMSAGPGLAGSGPEGPRHPSVLSCDPHDPLPPGVTAGARLGLLAARSVAAASAPVETARPTPLGATPRPLGTRGIR